ncbi:hypothetical protein KEJ39_01560 [Candidatus Bathyarchaeota archaeon]|nr:hypothetical protein [Candidatus Bathyarchaeota archaeon]
MFFPSDTIAPVSTPFTRTIGDPFRSLFSMFTFTKASLLSINEKLNRLLESSYRRVKTVALLVTEIEEL